MKQWNKETFGIFFENIKALENRLVREEKEFERDDSMNNSQVLMEVKAELEKALKIEEIF